MGYNRVVSKNPIPTAEANRLVGENMLRFRKQRGLRQVDVAARCTNAGTPLHNNVYSKMEKGDKRITVDELAAVASALDVPIASFFNEAPATCRACLDVQMAGYSCNACGSPPR